MSQKFSWIVRLAGAASVVGLLAVAGAAYAVVPTLNQTSITVGLGQSLGVTSQNNINVYMGSNSSSNIASISISGTQITVTGVAPGTTSVSICAVGTSSDCTTLYVTSQVGAVTTTSSTTTTASSTSGLSFSQNNLSLMAGGSQVVTVSGGNSSYNITGNSNPSVGSPSLSNGNSIVVYASAAGTDTITICDTANLCGTISMTVAASTANQAVTFSVPNPTLAVGQALNVTLSGPGATGFVVLSNINANVAQGTISGTTLTLTGLSAGTDSFAICATGGGCSSLSVTVTGGTGGTSATTTISPPTTSTNTPAPTVTSVVPTTIPTTSGTIIPNTTLLGEIQSLQSAVTQALAQIQLIQTQLNLLVAQVNAGAGSGGAASANTSASASFTELLTIGSTGAQVTALQNQLISLGYDAGTATGFYGPLTQEAVMKYQTAHGITATGYVGPSTRAALNGLID